MAGYLPMKFKRKDLDDVNDDFSEFSLSSPARKIRRLNADLPPIIEEEEPEMPLQFEQQPVPEFGASGSTENEERAIVLFKPMNNTPIFHSPSKFIVDSNLISSIKDQALCGANSNSGRPLEDEESKADERLSLIPWVPSWQFHRKPPTEAPEKEASEPMDAEETGAAMETGDNTANSGVNDCIDVSGGSESMQRQWQQQHCMIPQLPQNMVAPIAWYR